MLTATLRSVGLQSQKYVLEKNTEFSNHREGVCRQIQYKNTDRNAKIDRFYINFYNKNGMMDKSDDTHGITINILFTNSKLVMEFDRLCFNPIKPLYQNHCFTKDSDGCGANFISVFTYDKDIAKNFFLSIQKFDTLDNDVRNVLSGYLSFEIPDASASFTSIDTSIMEKMYQVGERQCLTR